MNEVQPEQVKSDKEKEVGTKKKKFSRNFGSPWNVLGTTIIVFILSQIIAAFIVSLVYALIHGGKTDVAAALNNSAITQFFYVLTAEGLAVVFVFYVLKNRGLKLSNIGLGRSPKLKDLISASVGFAVFYALLIVAGLIVTMFFPDINNNQTQDIGFNQLNNSTDHLLAFVALVFLPPIGEEILVRGYLYSGLRAYWSFVPSMIVTSILFGAAHLQTGSGTALLWIAGVDTFVLSLILVYLREKTGALYAGMLVHALNNLIAFGIHFR
jgi:membrane protease YdiL (CAAX protease family)